mmetsp:Transcript_3833/g.11747  ORF Transcript_3833/g.11747 Transcript_3833/m.11747 type:complete len:87 (-) Transcript_3833:61-321(-)
METNSVSRLSEMVTAESAQQTVENMFFGLSFATVSGSMYSESNDVSAKNAAKLAITPRLSVNSVSSLNLISVARWFTIVCVDDTFA